MTPRPAKQLDGRTHWEGCWRLHLDCAVAHVEELERQIEKLIREIVRQSVPRARE